MERRDRKESPDHGLLRVRQRRQRRTRHARRQEEEAHRQPGRIGQAGDRLIRTADRDERRHQAPHDPAEEQRRGQPPLLAALRRRHGQGNRRFHVVAPDRHRVRWSADEHPNFRGRYALRPPVAVDGHDAIAVVKCARGRAIGGHARGKTRARAHGDPTEGSHVAAVSGHSRGRDRGARGDDRANRDRQQAKAGPVPGARARLGCGGRHPRIMPHVHRDRGPHSPSTTTGSFPRPRWFDVSMWGRPLDTCMLDVRFREKFQDAMAVVISDQERAGLDILTHGDFHCDEDLAGRAWHHYPLQRWAGFEGDHLQPEETTAPWLHYPPGTLLNEIYTGWRWPHVVDKIEHRPLDYAKLWRIAQGKTRKPVKFGTCCSQVMALFLDIHTPKYKDKRQVIWDMAEAMNKELLALRDAGCRCIQIEEPTFHFMANTYGKDHDEVKFMIDAFNREVQGLDDVELWIHTCWGNPNMQRVMEDTSYELDRDLSRSAAAATSGRWR